MLCLRSFLVAFHGLGDLIRHERHAQVHLAVTVVLVPLGLWLGLDGQQWALLVLAMGLVWSAEALNTALERLADALHPGHHPLVGRAKDLGAAAVLIAAIAAAVIGLLVLGPPLLNLLFTDR